MKLIFAGTPEFARVALARLHAAGHDIALVLTQPDRPGGRGMKLQASPVKQFALDHAIAVAQPRSLRLDGKFPDDAAAAYATIKSVQADAMVVAAYGLILPPWLLTLPRLGCINIHASLLPRWRGAAPIHRAIEAGDATTGVTIMQMDSGLDTGDMLLTHGIPILASDTTGCLHDRLAELGAQLIVQVLRDVAIDTQKPVPQPDTGVTYAAKIDKREAGVDRSQPAEMICRRIRAFNPQPGCTTTLNGEVFKLWAAHPITQTLPEPIKQGVIMAVTPAGIALAAMNSIVMVTELQRPGGKRLAVADFLCGFHLQAGMAFTSS